MVAGFATLAMLLLRLTRDVPTVVELLAEWVTLWLPVGALAWALGTFGVVAKPLAFSALFLAVFLVAGAAGGLLAVTLGRLWSGTRQVDVSASGDGNASPIGGTRVWSDRRRVQLERVAWSGLAVVGGIALWRLVAAPRDANTMGATPGSRPARRGPDGLPAEITANADFYRVSKNLTDPRVITSNWRLKVAGLVGKPLVLEHQEVLDMPHVEQVQTLECISNEVGGDFMSTAVWSGMRFADLISMAGGADARAKTVVLRAVDRYSEGFALADLMKPSVLIATKMNGVELPYEHGFPLRLLVPGVYGMKNVKWLESIELREEEYRGYWQQRGWTQTGTVKTTSRIDVPRRGTVRIADVTRIAGIAYAGDRGISMVEVSADSGETWRRATLRAPRGPYAWVFWELPWEPRIGQARLVVRATDGRGDVQPEARSSTLPDGASGWHQVDVRVV